MINSFWNLCRACPMPTEEKLNSEYARNFTWHQGYQATNIEPVKKAPEATSSTMMEPVLPRKKKYPDVAYRTHQVVKHDGGRAEDIYGLVNPSLRFAREHLDIRARSEERSNISCKMGPRSRSADPNVGREKRDKKRDNPGDSDKAGDTEAGHSAKGKEEAPMALSYPPPCRQHGNPGPCDNPGKHGDQGINSTEYRSQYAWPRFGMEAVQPATRKSVSMGSIAAQALQMEGSSARLAIAAAIPILQSQSQRKVDLVPEGTVTSVRVFETKGKHKVDGKIKTTQDTKRLESNPFFLIGDHWKMKKTEYKAKFRPFSSYVYIDGGWKKPSKLTDVETKMDTNPWYSEVVERLKKADEYRWRAHGTPIYGEKQGVANRQPEVWSQSREKGLTVASTPRPTAHEDKIPKERPGTAPVPRAFSAAPSHRKEKKEREPKSEKSSRHKTLRKKETDTSEWHKAAEKPGALSAKRTSSAPARTTRFTSPAAHVAGATGGQKSSQAGRTPTQTTGTRRARPKSAEPCLSSKGEGKSPRHQIKPITTPPQLRSSATKNRDSMLNGPCETSGGTEDSKHQPVSSRSSFKVAKGSIPEHTLPSSKSRPTHAASSVSSVVNGDGKIWLKPVSSGKKSAENEKSESSKGDEKESFDRNDVALKETVLDDKLEQSTIKDISDNVKSDITDGPVSAERKEVVRPNTLPTVNGMDMKDGRLNGKDTTSPSSLPEPLSGPVPLTTVRSPEEVTGVKSPDPESWTVPLETGKGLEWTDGQTPGEEPTRAKSPPTVLSSKSVEPFTPQVNSEALKMQKEPDSMDTVAKTKQPSMEEVPSVEMVSPSTGRLLASDVLDRARSRLDQFWSKNK